MSVVRYSLASGDPEGSRAFYRDLFGWDLEEVQPASSACWIPHVGVADVERAASSATAAGGSCARHGAGMLIQDPEGGCSIARCEVARVDRRFCFVQLQTPRPSVGAFYQQVYGWRVVAFGGTAETWAFVAQEETVAGLMRSNKAQGCWVPYVLVNALDRAKQRVLDHGGSILLERLEIDVGVVSVIADRQGARLGLFQGHAAKH